MLQSSGSNFSANFDEIGDGELVMLEEDEGGVCIVLKQAQVLVIEECLLLRVDARDWFVVVNLGRFYRDNIGARMLSEDC